MGRLLRGDRHREARAIFRAIEVRDPPLRAAIARDLSPAPWRVAAVITVDEADPRWRKWLHDGDRSAPSFLVALHHEGEAPWCVHRAEIRALGDGALLGTIVHRRFHLDEGVAHGLRSSASRATARSCGARSAPPSSSGRRGSSTRTALPAPLRALEDVVRVAHLERARLVEALHLRVRQHHVRSAAR